MVAVLSTRLTAQVMMVAPAVTSVTRASLEIAASGSHASAEAIQATRLTGQVMSKGPVLTSVTRISIEVAASGAASGGQAVLATRMTAQAMTAIPKQVSVTRLSIEVAAQGDAASAQPLRVTRLTSQAMGRVTALPVVPLPLPSPEPEIFVHNWAKQMAVETVYLTDLSSSADDAREERRGLTPRPHRRLTFVWTDQDVDVVDRMLVTLRRLTRENIPMPLYNDFARLSVSIAPSSGQINFDTTEGRWHVGGRVALQKIDSSFYPVGPPIYRTIVSKMAGNVVVTPDFGVGGLTIASWGDHVIFPMVDCDMLLKPQVRWFSALTAEIKLVMVEKIGPSSLPPLDADNPVGFPTAGFGANHPIWNIEPDWTRGIRFELDDAGSIRNVGRGRIITTLGKRARTAYRWRLTSARTEALSIVRFMDSRRGRLRPFWLVDQEQVWTALDVEPSGLHIDVDPQGVFADFNTTDFEHVGLVMRDGTVHVRPVANIQAVLSVWRITVNPALPSGTLATDVIRISRARLVRNRTDRFKELWTTTELMTMDMRVIEVLEEGEVTL